MFENIWGFVIIGGPILLAGALIWAMTHNRLSKRQQRESEGATKQLYAEQAEQDRERGTDPG
ncbi:hypothetical protein [Sphingomonas endolithica]|jgi:hypothetical protein|uniref:hypothetical protein n=1 Tax=Sphingomonas endolithica TaxID=2972485 RepID=UPI0021AFA53E|nr:hypothetical protein [Sphingomonas sp. ZFBP2030]